MTGDIVRGKIESLMRYRNALDESERELFDVLMQYAKEVAGAVEGGMAPVNSPC